jgi:hypothetical protein
MNPILSRKVTRGNVLNEWEPAAHQDTMDGLNAFKERQRKRMQDAQGAIPRRNVTMPVHDVEPPDKVVVAEFRRNKP